MVDRLTDVYACLHEGLDHWIAAPIGTPKNLLIDEHEIKFARSMTERRESRRHDLKLDRLSEREKVDMNIICILLSVPILISTFN